MFVIMVLECSHLVAVYFAMFVIIVLLCSRLVAVTCATFSDINIVNAGKYCVNGCCNLLSTAPCNTAIYANYGNV